MEKRRKISCFYFFVSFLLFGYSVSAAFLPKIEIKTMNTGKTGIVDISLKEYTKTPDGSYTDYPGTAEVVPGQTISKIPVVFNEGMDCYIRISLAAEWRDENPTDELDRDELKNFTCDHVSGIDPSVWIYQGGYFYYTEVLKEKSQIEFFDTVHIPEEWGNEFAQAEFDLVVTAEAVQADNFTPDFTSVNPWGNVPIIEAIKTDDEERRSFKEPSMSIHFLNDSKRLVSSHSNLFEGFGTLMPGAEITRTVELTGDAEGAEIFFRTEPSQSRADLDLLEKIGLTITDGAEKKVLYEGNLGAEELKTYISLGTVGSEQNNYFSFTLSVPETLDNAYTLSELGVEWWFGADWEESDIPDVVTTGDINVEKYRILMRISAVCMVAFLLMSRGKGGKQL